MTYRTNLFASALTGVLLTATVAQAQDTAPKTGDMPMNEEHSLKDGDMSGMKGMEGMEGMMPMMKMMAQMGPMMEACTEMMQTMNAQMKTAEPEAEKG